MPLLRAVPVMLSAGERTALSKRVRGAKTAHRDRLRAQIVLAAACGRDNARIARDLGITVDTARKWRGRGGRPWPGGGGGGAGPPAAAGTGWLTCPGRAGRGGSAS